MEQPQYKIHYGINSQSAVQKLFQEVIHFKLVENINIHIH